MSPMAPRRPLVSMSLEILPTSLSRYSFPDEPPTHRKPWYHYLPLCGAYFPNTCCCEETNAPLGTIFLILAPHPSLLYVLVDFHLKTLHKPFLFATHLAATYTLTFMILSSLMICVTRDPGGPGWGAEGMEDGEIEATEALMSVDDDLSAPGRWCRKCWVIYRCSSAHTLLLTSTVGP